MNADIPSGWAQGQRCRAWLDGAEVSPFVVAVPAQGFIDVRDPENPGVLRSLFGAVTVQPSESGSR